MLGFIHIYDGKLHDVNARCASGSLNHLRAVEAPSITELSLKTGCRYKVFVAILKLETEFDNIAAYATQENELDTNTC